MFDAAAIRQELLETGSVFLPKFIAVEKIAHLSSVIDAARTKHPLIRCLQDYHLSKMGLPFIHEILFTMDHYRLYLEIIDRPQMRASSDSTSRRIGYGDSSEMPPLGPHIDAFYHSHCPTLNLWVPFQPCGDGELPGLEVARAPFDKVVNWTGYDGGASTGVGWNFDHFSPRMQRLHDQYGDIVEEYRETFERYMPRCEVGDAVLMTNWTFHATGPGKSKARRSNVEMRFWCDTDLNGFKPNWGEPIFGNV